jgi:hypothetical protein
LSGTWGDDRWAGEIGAGRDDFSHLGHAGAMAPSGTNIFSNEYRRSTIIPPISRPHRSAPLMAIGALIMLGAALIFVVTR